MNARIALLQRNENNIYEPNAKPVNSAEKA